MHVRRISQVLLVGIVIVVSGCHGLFDTSSTSAKVTSGGGGSFMCSRAAHTDLVGSLNTQCTQSSDCPSGGFCDITSFCNFECDDATPCPKDTDVCNCFGQCVGADTVDAGSQLDPACPKDPGKIAGAKGTRVCDHDDTCPYGTYCSGQTSKCEADCQDDATCAAHNDGKSMCDCFGRCVAAPGEGPRPQRRLPDLQALPPSQYVAGSAERSWSHLITVSLFTTDPDLTRKTSFADGGSVTSPLTLAVDVTLSNGLEASCTVVDGLADYTVPCPKVSPAGGWTFVPEGQGFRAQVPLWVRHLEGTGNGEKTWSVRLTSTDVSTSPVTAQIELSGQDLPPQGDWVPGWNPPMTGAGYSGTITVTPVSMALDPDDGNTQRDMQFPARAWFTPDGLTIFDDTHAISPSGQIPVKTTLSRMLWADLSADSSPLFPPYVTGHVSATTISKDGTPMAHSATGGIRGEVTLAVDAPKVIDFAGDLGPPPNTTAVYSVRYLFSRDSTVDCSAPGSCPAPVATDVGETLTFVNIGATSFLGNYNSFNVESLLCGDDAYWQTSPADPSAPYLPQLSTVVGSFSGDLGCRGLNSQWGDRGTEMAGANLLQYADLSKRKASDPTFVKKSSADLLAACMKELTQASGTDINPDPTAVPTTPTCVDFQHLSAAIEAARANINADEVSRSEGLTFPVWSPSTGRIMHRLVQQWLQIHSFVASQGLEEWRLHQVLASASNDPTDADAPDAARPLDLLDVLEKGWVYTLFAAMTEEGDFLAPGFAELPASVLMQPDYRVGRDGFDPKFQDPAFAKSHGHDQAVGLPVTLLETFTWHLKVLEAYIDDVAVDAYLSSLGGGVNTVQQEALARTGAAFGFGESVETIAGLMYKNVAGMNPPWKDRWDLARTELAGVRSRVLAKVRALSAGRNPLGIDEDDTPLFFGDTNGPNGKYFAASDYLVNTWATSAVASAQNTLGAARQAWLDARNAEVQSELSVADQSRRLETLQAQYGRIIIDNCGLVGTWEAKDVLDAVDKKQIDLSTCFINPDLKAKCADVPQLTMDAPPVDPTDQAAYKNALIAKFNLRQLDPNLTACLNDRLGLIVHHPAVPAGAPNCVPATAAGPQVQCSKAPVENFKCNNSQGACSPPGPICSCISPSHAHSAGTQGALTYCCLDGASAKDAWDETKPIDNAIDYNFLLENYAICADMYGIAEGEMPGINISRDCFRGKIGELGMSNIGALQDVYVAKANFRAAQGTYNLLAKNCADTEDAEHMVTSAADALNGQLAHWSKVRFYEDEAANALQGAAAAANSFSVTNPTSWVGAGAVLEVAATAARGLSLQAQKEMDDAKRNYDNFMAHVGAEMTIRDCWVEAEKSKLQIDSAMLQALRRQTDVNEGVIALGNLLRSNDQAFYEGKAAVERERGRFVSTVAHHYWVNEKIDRFHEEFEWAKLLTYMSMRAVEYEFQQSFPLREAILSASHPDQLETALRQLQQELATRTINRRRPDLDSAVLSLRDDILGVKDNLNQGAGERNWTAAQRFRGRLWDPAYTLYDENGNWLGQGIPFTLTPEGILKNRCGERLDRVTATIQGDGLDATDPTAPLLLLKKNTFASQWCVGHGDDNPLQVSSIQPTRQLFRPGSADTTSDQGQAYVSALMTPFFNVRRADFFKSEYQEGSSEELAGRGFYGDYILLFPKELLEGSGSLVHDVGVVKEQFPLDRVEDVLIRFDYLSVDNLPALSQ